MDVNRFDLVALSITEDASRRGLLRSLFGAAVGLAALQFSDTANAKQKHRKSAHRKGKHKRKKAKPGSASPPPPSSGPMTTTDAICLAAPPSIGEQTGPRLAQTFVAKRNGQLTSATVTMYSNEAGADFVLEIRDVDVGGTPTSTILASTSIANVPATIWPQTRTIIGNFASPATVVAGQVYALVVTETTGQDHAFFINGSNPCLDGILFRDALVNNTFDPRSNQDLVYATFVTA
jgi:hypothetical protein